MRVTTSGQSVPGGQERLCQSQLSPVAQATLTPQVTGVVQAESTQFSPSAQFESYWHVVCATPPSGSKPASGVEPASGAEPPSGVRFNDASVAG